jgi:hypothetical protein
VAHPSANIAAGDRFGRWTVVGSAERSRTGFKRWTCRCECGVERIVWQSVLLNGTSSSCGCYARERARENSTHGATVGYKPTAEWRVWNGMKRRCYDKKEPAYRNYGGRGITVCVRWLNDFAAFLADVGPRPPSDGKRPFTIERIDNNGNYEPGNVRWATWSEQCRNRRTSRMVTLNGETKSLLTWCEELSRDYDLVAGRLQKGWSVERAFNAPRRVWPGKAAV